MNGSRSESAGCWEGAAKSESVLLLPLSQAKLSKPPRDNPSFLLRQLMLLPTLLSMSPRVDSRALTLRNATAAATATTNLDVGCVRCLQNDVEGPSRQNVSEIFFGFLTPTLPRLPLELIYTIKFTQPHLLRPLFCNPLPLLCGHHI